MPRVTSSTSPAAARRRLRTLYKQSGWIHSRPDPKLRAKLKDSYKRGYELRIAVSSKKDLAELRRLLMQAGFDRSKPFMKINRIVQPIYGKDAVERFMAMVNGRS